MVYIKGQSKMKVSSTVTISRWPSFLNPVGEMPDEIEEEISLGYGNHFVGDFHEQRKALGTLEV